MKIDTQGMTPEQLQEALAQLKRESDKSSARSTALKEMDGTLRDRLQAEGVSLGNKWERPGDASEAYPYRWMAKHNGKVWQSLKSVNMDEPGSSDAWKEVSLEPPTIDEGDHEHDKS